MKKLILKELKLGLHPAIYICLLYSFMFFLPSYPPIIALIFPVVTIPQMAFSIANENRDYEFCSLLPIKKGDYVIMKMFDLIYPEILSMLVSLPIALISKYAVYVASNGNHPYSEMPGITSLLAVYGVGLFVYGVFNFLAVTLYFKRFPKFMLAIFIPMLAAFVLAGLLGILPAYIPGLDTMLSDAPEYLWFRILILLIGLLCYLGFNLLGYKFLGKRC